MAVVTIKNVFKNQVRKHITEILCTDYTEVLKDQLQNVVNAFYNWYGEYEQKRNPNWVNAFKDWLLGLPSELNAEYEYYTIHQIMKQWFENAGEIYKTVDDDKEAQLYYALVVREFIAMCKLNGVEVYK